MQITIFNESFTAKVTSHSLQK